MRTRLPVSLLKEEETRLNMPLCRFEIRLAVRQGNAVSFFCVRLNFPPVQVASRSRIELL